MKKLVLLATLLLPLTLAGCKNKKKDDFKEFDFGEKVIANERAEVLQKVFEQLKNVVSESVEKEEKTDLYNEYRLQKTKETINYYSNNYLHFEQTTESTGKEDGVTSTYKTTRKNDQFISSDSKFFATVSTYKDTIRPSIPEQLTYAYDVIPAEDDPADYFNVYPESDPTQFGGLDLYKKGKEYKLVSSSITETEEPVIYAEDTKTLHYIEKEQQILSINNKFRVTKGEYLYYEASNYDDNNKQYFDEVKIYNSEKRSSTYKYGTRKAGNFSALESQFNAPMLEVNTNNVGLGEYKDSAFTPKSNIPLNISTYYFESCQKKHVEFTFSFKATETDNAIAFDDNEADILNGVTSTDPIKDVMYKIPVGEFLSDIEGLSLAAEKTAEGHEIILAEPGTYKLRLSFDLAVTAADAVDVSNISLIQSYNYGGAI